MKNFELIRMGMLQAQVCGDGSWDEALEWIRLHHPAGTEANWQKDERPEVVPVICGQNPKRTHYIFVC
jgi:hypothetical protein